MTIDRLGAHWRRLGVTAVWTSGDDLHTATSKVMLDAPDVSILGDRAQSTEYSALYATSDFADMDTGDALVIAGVAYTVRGVEALDDGAIRRATLSKD